MYGHKTHPKMVRIRSKHSPVSLYSNITETQVWGTNYNRLATATMFTLFFAGDRFAPNFPRLKNKKKKKLTIQQYLQSHYIDTMKRVVFEREAREFQQTLSRVVTRISFPTPMGYSHL